MFLPLLAVLASIISLCVGSSFAKQLFAQIGPEGASVFRVGFAALILLAYWRPWRLPLSREHAKWIVLYGITLGSMNLLFYMGIKTVPIGVAIAIEFIGPLALAIYSSRRAMDFVWIGFAVLGLGLLLPLRANTASLDPQGVCYILCAAFLWALYIIFGKRAVRGHAGQVTSIGLAIGSLIVIPVGFTHALPAFSSSPSLILVGIVVAMMSSVIPYTLELYALKRMPEKTFGILLSMEPAVGAIAGWIILHEVLTPLQWVAIACIIIASIGCTLGLKKQDETPLADVVTGVG